MKSDFTLRLQKDWSEQVCRVQDSDVNVNWTLLQSTVTVFADWRRSPQLSASCFEGPLVFVSSPAAFRYAKGKRWIWASISVWLRGQSAHAVCMQSVKPKMTQAYLSRHLRLAGCECVPAAKVLPANNENSNS